MSRLATRYLTNRKPRAAKARIQTPPAPATPPISAASFLFCPASGSKGEIKFGYHDYCHCDVFQLVKTYVNFVFLFLCSLVITIAIFCHCVFQINSHRSSMLLLFCEPNKGTFLAKSKASLIGRQSKMSCQFRIPLQSVKHSRSFHDFTMIGRLPNLGVAISYK